jgi:glycosyltransferase involved in cell wall biosynthesis
VKISVAICTWNRAKLLDQCLDRLLRVSSPTAVWELIVIDNNGTDDAGHVLDSFVTRLPLRRQGLMHGRRVEFDMEYQHGFYGVGLAA